MDEVNGATTAHRRRLRVAVPEDLIRVATGTGHGNLWHQVLDRLAASVELVAWDRRSPWRRRSRPDVWLADGTRLHLDGRRPLVVQIHEAGWGTPELDALFHPGFLEMLDGRLRSSLAVASRVITPSASAATQVTERFGVDPAKVRPVHSGVDTACYRPGVAGGAQLVGRAGGEPDRPYVLFVSTAHPRKNLASLRAAMDELALAGLAHQLVIVTTAPHDRPDGEELVRAAGRPLPRSGRPVVRVEAPTDEQLAALMGGAAAFCLPSFNEGFGMSVLEAMACACPVVVADRGSLPEVVGDAGLVVAPAAESVHDALHRVLTDADLAQGLGAAALRRARGFSWEATARGWLAVLRDAAQEATSRLSVAPGRG